MTAGGIVSQMDRTTARSPRIVVTVGVAARQADPDIARRKTGLYVASVTRHGATPIVLDATAGEAERTEAFAAMDGLLLTGGADVDPARYGRPNQGSTSVEPDRDTLEATAWAAAQARALPVLGLCRGLQAINVFSGGTLVQDLGGHAGPGLGPGAGCHAPAARRAGDPPGADPVPDDARGASSRSIPITTRPSARAISLPASLRARGRAVRVAISSKGSKRPTTGSYSESSATLSGPNRRRQRSSACSPSSWMPRGARSTGAEPTRSRERGVGRRIDAAFDAGLGGCGSVEPGPSPGAGSQPPQLVEALQEEELVDLAQRPAQVRGRQAAHERRQAGRLARGKAADLKLSESCLRSSRRPDRFRRHPTGPRGDDPHPGPTRASLSMRCAWSSRRLTGHGLTFRGLEPPGPVGSKAARPWSPAPRIAAMTRLSYPTRYFRS